MLSKVRRLDENLRTPKHDARGWYTPLIAGIFVPVRISSLLLQHFHIRRQCPCRAASCISTGPSITILLFIANFFPVGKCLFPLFASSLPLLVQQGSEFLRNVKHTTSSRATRSTRWILPIAVQSARFAEVVTTLGQDGVCIRFLADDAGKWNAFQQFVIIIVLFLVGRACTFALRDDPPNQFLAICADLPVAIEFPSLLVVFSCVKEFA